MYNRLWNRWIVSQHYYRRNVVQPHELLLSLKIPFTREDQHFVAYKQSKRRDDDIAIVNSAFWLTLRGDTVAELRISAV